ncbi:MAG: SH3 domain-containing protein [candidate division KSB1 bacterium]|nr:SH3 domain-containing protein [candidate division KSB1 bacterium]
MKRYFFLILFFFHVVVVYGQMKLSFSSNSIGARANVLHSGYVGVANDYAATYWNPAGMVTVSNYHVGASSGLLPFDQQSNLIAAILPIREADRIGISWAGYYVNNIEARQSNSDLPDYLFEVGEQAIWLSYARRFGKISFGLNAKYLSYVIDGLGSHGYGFDIGALLALKKWQFGFSAYDVMAQIYWGNGMKENFQKVFRCGAEYLASTNWSLIAGIEMYHIMHPTINFYFASEYLLNEKFDMKIGIHPKRIAVGFGFNQPIGSSRISFDYAVQTNPIFDYKLSHFFDIQISFQKQNKEKQKADVKFRKDDLYQVSYAEIIADWANVRLGPGLNYPIITKVYIGERFVALGQQRDEAGKLWWKIKLGNNQTGWIRQDFVKVTEY